MRHAKQLFTAIMLTGLLFSPWGVKAQDPISNNNPFGQYTGSDQNVIINNDPSVAPVTSNPNSISGNVQLNLAGGDGNTIDGSGGFVSSSIAYGAENEIRAKEQITETFAFGADNDIGGQENGANYQWSGAFGVDNEFTGFGRSNFAFGAKNQILKNVKSSGAWGKFNELGAGSEPFIRTVFAIWFR